MPNKYYCEECGKEITREEMKRNIGLCEKCFWEESEEESRIFNRRARLVKQLSALISFLGILIGICMFAVSFSTAFTVTIISITIYILGIGLGEIIQLLEDIKNKLKNLINIKEN